MASEKSRAVLQFNEYDFRHRKVLEILRERPRSKTELVVNAVLHYVSCPDAAEDFSKDSMRRLIREVFLEMQAEGSLPTMAAVAVGGNTNPISSNDADDLGDLMAAFRG